MHESVDHVNWYIFNPYHSSLFGDYDMGSVATAGDLNVTNPRVASVDLNPSLSLKRPYCDRVSLMPDPWFRYDKHDATFADMLSFKACFSSKGSWAGKGDVGMSVDLNVSRNRNMKLDW